MSDKTSRWECEVCGYVYDENAEGTPWADLPDDWECPVCGAGKDEFVPEAAETAVDSPTPEAEPQAEETAPAANSTYLAQWARKSDEKERWMSDIHTMAATGSPITEPMGATGAAWKWEDILVLGAQLARRPLNEDEPVATQTVIGPKAAHPLTLEMPIYVSHMSFGALSKEAKLALAKGSAAAKTAMCSGEGGILPESLASAHRYIFEYVPNQYSVTPQNLRAVDAIEIKVGQSAKPGMGGHLPGMKVSAEIAEVRQRPQGLDIVSPARFPDISSPDDLRERVAWLRKESGGKPIGIKLAAGHIEADLEFALKAAPDFITIDGRPGGTGSAPKHVKAATSVPTIAALVRARKYLDSVGAKDVSLVITGGLRVSADIAKAIALGADAVALATSSMIACGCQQYRVCHTGKCPVGIATQDPELRARLNVEESARRVANFYKACNEELKMFARLTGHQDIHGLTPTDLWTANPDIARATGIATL
ncbi:MAG: glutamate synthase-related protein [Verrucomicrobiota bacterium]|jgi:glutamate synthase domain-containing protein 2|nr:glutamate synthase-related protein [Verrucomicrobiota bacterium]